MKFKRKIEEANNKIRIINWLIAELRWKIEEEEKKLLIFDWLIAENEWEINYGSGRNH